VIGKAPHLRRCQAQGNRDANQLPVTLVLRRLAAVQVPRHALFRPAQRVKQSVVDELLRKFLGAPPPVVRPG
jgi:hypothetical protein